MELLSTPTTTYLIAAVSRQIATFRNDLCSIGFDGIHHLTVSAVKIFKKSGQSWDNVHLTYFQLWVQ